MRERLARLLYPQIFIDRDHLQSEVQRLAAESSNWQSTALRYSRELEAAHSSARKANSRANYHLRQLCDFLSQLVWGKQMFGVAPDLPEKVAASAPGSDRTGPVDHRPRPIRQRQQQGVAEFIRQMHDRLGLEDIDGANTSAIATATAPASSPIPTSAPTAAAGGR